MTSSAHLLRCAGAALLLTGLTACADGGVRSDKPVPPLTFSCPVGVSTILSDAIGRRRRIDWLGADASDPNLCLSAGGVARRAGVPDKRMFARWAPGAMSGTTEELAHFKTSVDQFMHGRAPNAQFILRDSNTGRISGQQLVQQMTIKGLETLTIDGRPVETVKIRINYTFSGNNATWSADLWFDPETNLWVKQVGSLELGPEFTWSVDRIINKPEA